MNVIITGASKGIGKGIATVLAKDGFRVGLMARSSSLLRELQQKLGENCFTAACDLRDMESTHHAIASLRNDLGSIDTLINNAGLIIRKDIFMISVDEWRAMMETNINGLFYATKAVLPAMKEQGSGHIVNISSISGKVPLPGGSGYAASKYAVTGFSESLFHEVRQYGIKVTTVFPGSVDSESHRHGPQEDTRWKITPEEVGETCCHLLRTGTNNCISHVEIRPLHRPPQ